MRGCNNCPARSKCTGLTYRGSDCAALRHRYGAPGDPEMRDGADDLISRKALEENHFSDDHNIALSYADKCWIRRIIREQPAVDPVKHGRWIIDNAKLLYCGIHCSECGFGSDYAKRDMWMNYPGHKFCGACGAKMDLEATSNEAD